MQINFNVHPWMDIATSQLGVAEIPGPKSNPQIDAYLAGVGLHSGDETAWCSAFVNWCLRNAGYAVTGKANARSWEGYGITLDKPCYGCGVVLWRGNPKSWQGHVGFWIREPLWLIGGNQNNSVCGAPYELRRVLRYFWPVFDE